MELLNITKYLEDYGKNLTTTYTNISGYNKVTYTVRRMDDICILELDLGDYWKWIEYGRKGGKMPPINSIVKWIKKKGLTSNRVSLKSMAFAIAKNVSKRGLKPKLYFLKSKQRLPDFKLGLDAALKKDLEEYNKKNLKLKKTK